MKKDAGFTLIELLVALVLVTVVLGLVVQLLAGGASSTDVLSARGSLIREGQVAQQIITGRLNEAIYVYPSNMPYSMVLGTGITVQNPNGTYKWTINTDPFVAMILPPPSPTYGYDATTGQAQSITNCTSNDPSSGTSAGCYRFFAYYPVLRSRLSTLLAPDRPAIDPANDNQWVIMEYRAVLYNGSAWTPRYDSNLAITNPPDTSLYQSVAGNTKAGRILTDYVQPGSMTVTVTNPGATDVVSGDTAGTGSVAVSFAMQRLSRGTTVRASSTPLGATVSPRNWRCAATCATP